MFRDDSRPQLVLVHDHGGETLSIVESARIVAAKLPQNEASVEAALCDAIPGRHPPCPGQTRRGRSASVILTSPPLLVAEVRITTAPLRKRK